MAKAFNKSQLKKILKYDVISFDIFDTLIKRNIILPKDIFKIVEIEFNSNNKNCVEDFVKKRIEAENQARSNSKLEEINLDEIYSYINLDEAILNELKRIEIETEQSFCTKNNEMYSVYKKCKELGKKIICISDMYLSKDVIKEILEKNGYDINDVFISCEYKKTKLNGTLFKKVLEEINVDKNQIIHIGDSYKADMIGALKCGIKSIHVKKFINNCSYLDFKREKFKINESMIKATINNNIFKYDDNLERMGYEIIGPIFVNFCNWLNEASKKNKIDNLLFCARDMQIIHKIYNILYPNEIHNQYFYVSRKSIYLPYLFKNNNFESFSKLIPPTEKQITILELLLSFNIKLSNLNEALVDFDLDGEKKYLIKNLKYNKNFERFYDSVIYQYINSAGKEQYENLVNYVDSLTINNNIAIVDLGWRGTTQEILIKILNEKVCGMYFGLNSNKSAYLNENNCWTYLFDGESDKYCKEIYSYMSIVELIFSANHGSTIGYSDKKEKPYILSDSKIKDKEFIDKIHRGALEYTKDIAEYNKYISNEQVIFVIDEFIKLGIKPTLYQTKVFGDIESENLSNIPFACPKNIFSYLFNIRLLKDDFNNSDWKIGFLKRLLKINLPYYEIYNYFRLKRDRKGELDI